jgi:predicted NodU family carbamoyl transferase
LNAFHGDSSACLLKDGVLIAAAEEERFDVLNIGQVFHQKQFVGVYQKQELI